MLNERERRDLTAIEQQLAASDPEFVLIFRSPVRRSVSDLLLLGLLLLGLALVVVGSATVAVSVAALGTAITLASSVLIARRSGGTGFSPVA